jgi:hypothetical protein
LVEDVVGIMAEKRAASPNATTWMLIGWAMIELWGGEFWS